MTKVIIFQYLASIGIRFFEPGGREFESLRAHFWVKLFGSPGHEIGNEQIEPLTDNKTVRSEAEDERRSGEQCGPGAIQISLKAPNMRLDRELRRASYTAIRSLSNVRAAPQVTTLKALMLPTPRCFTQFPGFIVPTDNTIGSITWLALFPATANSREAIR